jgi:hypothetical protein
MNHPEEITPQYAERLVALLGMMGDLGRDRLAFLVGHMAAKDVDLAIEAFGALMGTELPLEDSLAGWRPLAARVAQARPAVRGELVAGVPKVMVAAETRFPSPAVIALATNHCSVTCHAGHTVSRVAAGLIRRVTSSLIIQGGATAWRP